MKQWLLRHRAPVLFLALLLAGAGALDATRVPVALFPTLDFPRIVVNVEAGDRPIDRMVADVTLPLEQAVRAVADVRGVRSTTSRGAADLSIRFAWGTDMGRALLDTESALARVRGAVPDDVEFETRRMDPTVFPVLGFSLTSKTKDLVAVRDVAVHQLQPLLSTVDGVARVDVVGGARAEVQVAVDPLRLKARGVSVDDVKAALGGGNVLQALGRIEDHDRLYLVVAEATLNDVEQVEQRPVRADGSGVVVVGDVADVSFGRAINWTRVTADGHDAVLLEVLQQRAGNTVQIEEAVRSLLREQEHALGDVVVSPYYDQGELVRGSSASVRDAIWIGALIAGLVLFLFLRDLRITLVVAVTLPAVLAAVVLVLDRLHMGFNVMTLGGMAAATGLIIDDAVVVVEHIARRRPSGTGVLDAGREMLRPLLGSSVATVVVFVPLAFLGGVAGGFFKALAITIATSLVVSFVVAFVVVPLLAELVLPSTPPLEHHPRWLAAMQRAYQLALRRLMQRPWAVVVVVVAVAAAGATAFAHLGQGFLPALDEGGFILDYNAPPGSSVSETDRLLKQVETRIALLPEVKTWARRTGLQLGGGLTESNTGDFFIRLKPFPRRDIEEVMAELRDDVEQDVPALRIETVQLMEDVIGDLTAVPQPIEVKLFSDDPPVLARAAHAVAAKLETINGVVEVFDGITVAGDDLAVVIDPVRAGLEGLKAADVVEQGSRWIDGDDVTEMVVGERRIPVAVRSAVARRDHLDDVDDLTLVGAGGQLVPLGRVATIAVREGQAEVTREDLKTMIAVTARVEGRDLGSAMDDVKAAVAAVDLGGIRVSYGGLYAEQQRSLIELSLVFASAVVLVVVLLMFLLRRLQAVVAIATTTLLSTSGVFIGLWLTDTELNIAAMMGLTMVVGVVTEIGIFFFVEVGHDLRDDIDSLVAAGAVRLRPILMTSSIAALSLLPLATGLGEGAGLLAPLAVAIIAGLMAAVPLVLVVMPALFCLLCRGNRIPVHPLPADGQQRPHEKEVGP